jgi:hypothetical protein
MVINAHVGLEWFGTNQGTILFILPAAVFGTPRTVGPNRLQHIIKTRKLPLVE